MVPGQSTAQILIDDIMKRALFLTHVPPYPVVGGDRLRISQSLKLLGEVCDVDIAFISHKAAERSVKAEYKGVSREYCFYAPRLRRYCRSLRTLFGTAPEAVNHFYDRRLMRFVRSTAADYDLLFCASPVMAQYARASFAPLKLLDMTDSLTMNYERASAASTGLKKLLYGEEARRMRRFESETVDLFDRVAYISAADRDYLPGGNKVIVGNAVDEAGEAARCEYRTDARDILFVGKMDYEPNVRAVEFFARQVMPLLHEHRPDCRFVIAGASPVASVKALDVLPGVTVTGFVPSLDKYYRECALVVAPMLSGSGVQNKILHALAAGCCVVTSAAGYEGLECLGDVLTLVPENRPETWVAALEALLENPSEIRRLGGRSPQRIEEEFGLSGIRREFRAFLGL